MSIKLRKIQKNIQKVNKTTQNQKIIKNYKNPEISQKITKDHLKKKKKKNPLSFAI